MLRTLRETSHIENSLQVMAQGMERRVFYKDGRVGMHPSSFSSSSSSSSSISSLTPLSFPYSHSLEPVNLSIVSTSNLSKAFCSYLSDQFPQHTPSINAHHQHINLKMKFSANAVLRAALCASTVSALTLPNLKAIRSTPEPRAVPDSTQSATFSGTFVNGSLVKGVAPVTADSQDLQKRGAATSDLVELEDRQALTIALSALSLVGQAAATAIVTQATNDAYEAVKSLITSLSQWNEAREVFTQNTTSVMWANNPDYSAYPAAICYNKNYSMKNTAGFLAKGSVTLTVGSLHTDYDCLYMSADNAFYTYNEGGYINLAYMYDSNKCSFDSETGDLTCTA